MFTVPPGYRLGIAFAFLLRPVLPPRYRLGTASLCIWTWSPRASPLGALGGPSWEASTISVAPLGKLPPSQFFARTAMRQDIHKPDGVWTDIYVCAYTSVLNLHLYLYQENFCLSLTRGQKHTRPATRHVGKRQNPNTRALRTHEAVPQVLIKSEGGPEAVPRRYHKHTIIEEAVLRRYRGDTTGPNKKRGRPQGGTKAVP